MSLDAKREKACKAYVLNGGNKSEAFRDAFPHSKKWKPETVNVRASQLFKEDKVQIRVAELEEQAKKIAEDKFSVDATYVLKRLIEIDQMDVSDILADDGGFKPIHQWPVVWRTYLSGIDLAEMYEGYGDEREMAGILKKIKWPNKIKNLELLGKHKAIKAFVELKEVSGSVDHNHTHVGLSETDRFIEDAIGKGKNRASTKPVSH